MRLYRNGVRYFLYKSQEWGDLIIMKRLPTITDCLEIFKILVESNRTAWGFTLGKTWWHETGRIINISYLECQSYRLCFDSEHYRDVEEYAALEAL